MGREAKILLGFLGLLAGAFLGVLSMKLLVPRPPAGAGPDIQTEFAASEPHDLVEPPRLTMRASDFAAAPPLVPARAPDIVADPPASPDRFAMRDGDAAAAAPPPFRRDPFVTAAAYREPETGPAAPAPFDAAAAAPADEAPAEAAQPSAPAADPLPAPAAIPADRPPAVAPSTSYLVQPGDSWWSLAERAYGDGRLYRALFAWNRAVDPRVTLAPGTPLQIPPLADLAGSWAHLMPARQP